MREVFWGGGTEVRTVTFEARRPGLYPVEDTLSRIQSRIGLLIVAE